MNAAHITSAGQQVGNVDFAKLYALGPQLVTNPALLEESKKTPEAVAKREVGLSLPLGVHLHFIDQDSNYFPAEGDAISQLNSHKSTSSAWGRVEFRVGGGDAIHPHWCIGACNICF